MKKIGYILLLVVVIVSSCGLIDDLLTFKINHSTEFTIPGTNVIGVPIPLDLLDQEITTNSSEEFENNNTSSNLVKDILLEELNTSIISPENETFAPLNDIEIFIQADGQPKKLIAWQYNIPESVGRELELETTSESLDEYIKQEKFVVDAQVTADGTFGEDTDIKVDMKFSVTADPF